MLGIASIDGNLSTIELAQLSVLDRGFQYGDAVFEALRTYRGRADGLDAHLARLEQSCAKLFIEIGISREEFAGEVQRAIEALEVPERYVRIMVTRGDKPESLAPFGGPARARRVILVRPLPAGPSTLYERGIKVSSIVAPPSPLWAGAKPTAYLNNLLAIGHAQRAGRDDALLLGAHGELLEGATSSVFVVKDGALLTPPLSLGILPGITRDRVLACAAQAGIAARERLMHIGDAYRADELFLTSSVRRVIAVTEVDGLAVGTGMPGPITQRIADAYRALTESL
ncbi:MAG TPA: aminotransferase class IV [Polyangiales bacterium]